MHSALYYGWVRHRRLTPRPHAFRYRLFMLYLDLDELAAGRVFAGNRLWRNGRGGFALARFRREDYHGDPDRPLADCVAELVAGETGRPQHGPIRLLTHVRYFGYCFNPISVYYCFDADGVTLNALVAEVSNTPWGERRCYVLDAHQTDNRTDAGADSGRAQRFEFDKRLHVSPFMAMHQRYRWRGTTPGDHLGIHMDVLNRDGGDKLFDASLRLERRAINGRSLAAALAGSPPMTFKVVAAIYWQALRLWLKRTPLCDHPTNSTAER